MSIQIPSFQPILPFELQQTTTPLTSIQSNQLFATLIATTYSPFNGDKNNNNKLMVMSTDETFHSNLESSTNFNRLHNLNKPFNSKQSSIESLLKSIAGQPVLEQQLRYLDKHFGYDANANFPDHQTIEALRRFIGTNMMPSTANSLPLPASVAKTASRGVKNLFINNNNNVGEDEPKLLKRISMPTNFKPILPVNNQQVKNYIFY